MGERGKEQQVAEEVTPRFEEVRQALKPKRSAFAFTGGCELCGVAFDSCDAKIWTRETGKAHFACYLKGKGKLKELEEWKKAISLADKQTNHSQKRVGGLGPQSEGPKNGGSDRVALLAAENELGDKRDE